MNTFAVSVRRCAGSAAVAVFVMAGVPWAWGTTAETKQRSRIAAASFEDAVVVDCQLPGKLQKLGGVRTYLTPGVLLRLSAVDCRARGGEYTLGDLSSGTLSLQRWLPLAEQGQAQAQYYVARIYANGMGGVAVDYQRAAHWYRRAAEQNFASAQQELGYLHEQGLGVPKDPVLALNLQRQAAGLGEELDYASKIAEAQDEAARQVAVLSEQLDASNAELQSLRAQLQSTTEDVFRSRAELSRQEATLSNLRGELSAAQARLGKQGDGTRVEELQGALRARENALAASARELQALTQRMEQQQAQFSTRMAQSQVASRELNELLVNERLRARSLQARLAQADQRLLRSQQELAQQRSRYRREVEQLLAEHAALERAAGDSKDDLTGLLATRERELTRQQQRVAALEQALADKKREQAAVSGSAATRAQLVDTLRSSLAELQASFDQQKVLLQQRQSELATMRARAQTDRDAVLRDLRQQLGARQDELQDKQRRLLAITAETTALRSEVERLNAERDRELDGAADEATRARASLRIAQQKLAELRERLEALQTDKAAELAALVKARDELQRQMASNREANQLQVGFLSKELDARQKDLASRDGEIARLEQRLQDQSRRFNAMLAQSAPRQPATVAAPAGSAAGAMVGSVKMRSPNSGVSSLQKALHEFRDVSRGSYHALIIGNSLYHYMEPLDTPANDARAIGELLRERYGFKVKLLLDATREQIMTALHDAKLQLTPRDSLLIYYAGHGALAGASSSAFWLGVDANPDTRAGWLEADHIRAKIKEMDAKHVLLVADSCFSGAITHPKTTTIGRGLNETRLRVQWNRRARMVLTSGQVTPVADNTGADTHSVFARYFIQSLRQNDNVMSGEMLSHEVSSRMRGQPVRVGSDGQRQTPTYSTLQDANHDVGDFFFVPMADTARLAALE